MSIDKNELNDKLKTIDTEIKNLNNKLKEIGIEIYECAKKENLKRIEEEKRKDKKETIQAYLIFGAIMLIVGLIVYGYGHINALW